uniref:Ycf55 n=1 Tax=Pterocladia lucida TaxID=31408 RepID=A0A6M3WVV8_PTELU|nr:Ycf55 [Pterocladia lucida]
MTRLWPKNSGIDLNNEVAYLFFSTKDKFSNNLINKTNYSLCIDILNNHGQRILFKALLDELQILVLDLVELNLSVENIQVLNYKIVCDLINKSRRRFLQYLASYISDSSINVVVDLGSLAVNQYTNLVLSEYKIILQQLLVYMIFGSSAVNDYGLGFINYTVPSYYISILLETSVLHLGNLIICTIIDSCASLSKVSTFLNKYKLCNISYLSIRSLACFKNLLVYQNLIYSYIDYPKAIYNCRYRVLLLSSQGIVSKYIYCYRFKDISSLSSIQLGTIFFIELQDVIIPKLEQSLLILGKLVVYVLINLVANFFILIVKIITSRLYSRII